MKTILIIVTFSVMYIGFALGAMTIYNSLADKWYGLLVYAVLFVMGFGLAYFLRDGKPTCPCCKSDS